MPLEAWLSDQIDFFTNPGLSVQNNVNRYLISPWLQISFLRTHGITSGLHVPASNYETVEEEIDQSPHEVKMQNFA